MILPEKSVDFSGSCDRDTARREVAIEQHLAVEPVKPHRGTQRVAASCFQRRLKLSRTKSVRVLSFTRLSQDLNPLSRICPEASSWIFGHKPAGTLCGD